MSHPRTPRSTFTRKHDVEEPHLSKLDQSYTKYKFKGKSQQLSPSFLSASYKTTTIKEENTSLPFSQVFIDKLLCSKLHSSLSSLKVPWLVHVMTTQAVLFLHFLIKNLPEKGFLTKARKRLADSNL